MIEHRDEFGKWLTDNGFTGTGIEIGVYYGEFSKRILENWCGKIVGVDPYINYSPEEYRDGCNLVNLEEAMQAALETLKPFGERFRLIREPSVEAAGNFSLGSVDFVYIDGNHRYSAVRDDLVTWYPIVKPGGMICGHDAYTRHDDAQWCEVPEALEWFFGNRKLNIHFSSCSSWWVRKPKPNC